MTTSPHVPHPIQRRYWAEDLIRLRRADEDQRFAAPQRRGRIDPNPHQIEAVIFALRRIRDGGCILADEVGLGKTIEAGLVIAQLLAEGARRVLLILPKTLIGQWSAELYDLFGIRTREGHTVEGLVGDGVFVVGREFAGSDRGSRLLTAAEPFDLCVIDEAHEIFAGIYKRFDRQGVYQSHAEQAVMAHRVRTLIGRTPVLLLTATPIQNTLTELWGLVQYVEPTGTLLGNLATFRQLFCEPGAMDRFPVPDQVHELRRRIETVCQRTLRRQAQEFLDKKFVARRAKLFEYRMSDAERALYDDVTDYLLEPDLCAFRGSQRRLLLIGFLRRMASSLAALAASLKNVAGRLRKILDGTVDDAAQATTADLEDEDLVQLADETDEPAPPSLERVRAELARVESFIDRAESLPSDAKAQALVNAVQHVLEQGRSGVGSGKVVIFTESLTTQDYLQELLLKNGLEPGDITLFRGVNDSPRVTEALQRWRAEVLEPQRKLSDAKPPSRDVAVRQALVHEFTTRSRVFIATEAGAKGLNLQFCETLVNYDLPWNPQRIEQRIGRCHRYGQVRDVTVINFLASDNEAQRLTFQILSQKLELFGQVLDASDVVLHQPESESTDVLAGALAADFESQFQRIYQRARSRDELTAELKKLSETMGEERKRFEDVQRRTASLIESRLDDSVRQVFRRIQSRLPDSLARLDAAIERVVTSYLTAAGIEFVRRAESGRVRLEISPSPHLPKSLATGGVVVLGSGATKTEGEPLHLGHPLVTAAVAESRVATQQSFRVRLRSGHATAWLPYRGRRGRLILTKARYSGFEPVEHLLPTLLLEGHDEPLPVDVAESFFNQEITDDPEPVSEPLFDDDWVADAVDETLFLDQTQIASAEQARFDRLMEQIERYADDQCLVGRQQRAELERRYQAAQRSRDTALGADARAKSDKQLRELETRLAELDQRIELLSSREDPEYRKWRDYALTRRFVPPLTERLLDVEFVVD